MLNLKQIVHYEKILNSFFDMLFKIFFFSDSALIV